MSVREQDINRFGSPVSTVATLCPFALVRTSKVRQPSASQQHSSSISALRHRARIGAAAVVVHEGMDLHLLTRPMFAFDGLLTSLGRRLSIRTVKRFLICVSLLREQRAPI